MSLIALKRLQTRLGLTRVSCDKDSFSNMWRCDELSQEFFLTMWLNMWSGVFPVQVMWSKKKPGPIAWPVHTLSIANIRNTFLILSCKSPFALRTATIRWGMDSTRCRKRSTVVSSWLDVLWVLDHSWYTQETDECETPSSAAVLDTNRCAWHLLPYPVQTHLHVLSCPFNLWMAHTQSMSQLFQDLHILL